MPTPKDENTQEEEVLPAPMEDTLVCTSAPYHGNMGPSPPYSGGSYYGQGSSQYSS